MNEAGRRIEEQYADTGGFTDHLFGISAMLGYRLVLRIRDLPSKRLYVFDPAATPAELRPLVGGKAREALIVSNWPDLFRCAATMSTGQVAPSRILRKLAAYPRQNDLAAALREVGRIERTLFIIEWILDTGMQRRAQVGLNKGEAHHALKNALRIGRQGEIRDRTTEGQHYRIAGVNLLTAIIVYWNTSAMPSKPDDAKGWIRPTIFSPMSHRWDGRTSSSPANTSGPRTPTLRPNDCRSLKGSNLRC
ncbi:transposase for transposon Tn3926 [Sphingomonas sp. LH128]|nr:transposase for transposon Tn3926 [Sphingomonas sp. LH128]